MLIATIDLGGTRTKFGLIQDGTLIASAKCEARPGGSIETHLNQVAKGLEQLCVDSGLEISDCLGLGMLHTGIVDNRNMRVLSTNGKYDDACGYDFSGWARQRLGLELRMDNDARGALLGEWVYGAAKGCRDAMMMTVGTGIGTAVLLDGRPLVGSNFSGGLLGGHIIINSGGSRCTCGAVGCLEAETGGWALPFIVGQHPEFSRSSLLGESSINFKVLFDHAAAEDQTALDVRDRCLQLWGEAVVSFIHLYDPQKVIIGGGVMNEPDLVLQRVGQVVEEMVWSSSSSERILPAAHPDNAGIYGAAALFD